MNGYGLGLSPQEVGALWEVEDIANTAAAHDRAEQSATPELPEQDHSKLKQCHHCLANIVWSLDGPYGQCACEGKVWYWDFRTKTVELCRG